MVHDYSEGAFRYDSLTFVAEINASGISGGISRMEIPGITMHAHSTYVCDAHKSCVPYEIHIDPTSTTA